MSKYIADPKYNGTLERAFAILLDNAFIALNKRDRRHLATDDELVQKMVAIAKRHDLTSLSSTYRLSTRDGLPFVMVFMTDDDAFEYAHDMTDDDSAVVQKKIDGAWADWDREHQQWVWKTSAE